MALSYSLGTMRCVPQVFLVRQHLYKKKTALLTSLFGEDAFLRFYGPHRTPFWCIRKRELGPMSSHLDVTLVNTSVQISRLFCNSYFYSLTSSNAFFLQCVKFHQNCTYLATASTDQTCRLWDLQSGNCVRLFTGHKVLEQQQ